MVALYQPKYVLHYWTSLCFFGTFYVSAIEYCQKSENGISTGCEVNDCNNPPLPKLPDFLSCSSQDCLPVTTTELPSTSTWSTSDQPTTGCSSQDCLPVTTTELPSTSTWSTSDQPTTGITATTGVTLTHTTTDVRTQSTAQSTPKSTPEITSPDGPSLSLSTPGTFFTDVTHTTGGISGTPITTPKTTTGGQRTTPIITSQGERTTATDQPINSAPSSQPASHTDVTTATQNETVNGTDGEGDGTTILRTVPPGDNAEGTTISTSESPGDNEGKGLAAWAIVIIVFAIILIAIVVVGLICLLLKKKNATCKVHCGSDGDTSSNPKLSVLPLPHGKVTVLRHHQDGSLVLEPSVAAQNPSSCINSSSPAICPTGSSDALDQGNSSTPPIVGDAQAVQMPNVPNSTDTKQDDLRDRTLSTSSHTVLIPDNAYTSQQPKKKKKKKKKDETNSYTQSPIQLKPLRAPSKPSDEVV